MLEAVVVVIDGGIGEGDGNSGGGGGVCSNDGDDGDGGGDRVTATHKYGRSRPIVDQLDPSYMCRQR